MASAEQFSYSNFLTSPEGKEVPLVIGSILYANDTKLAVVGVNKQHDLVTGFAQAPEQFNPNRINRRSSRVLRLPDYDSINVVRVDLGSIELGTSRSILRPERTITAHLYYIDPSLGPTENHLVLEEDHLLHVMTGEQGGVMVFHGEGLPEEDALVIKGQDLERQISHAFVAFFHPSEAQEGLDSTTGTYEFFHRVNQEFLSKSPQPLQDRVVRTLERAIQYGELADTKERLELLRAQFIAHARLAIKHPTSQKFLTDHLPELTSSFTERMGRILGQPSQKPPHPAVGAINTIFVDRKPVVESKKTKLYISGTGPYRGGSGIDTSQEDAVKRLLHSDNPLGLHTPEMRKLYKSYHDELGSQFGNNNEGYVLVSMNKYLLRIVGSVPTADTLEKLFDIDRLLEEILTTKYGRTKGHVDDVFSIELIEACSELDIWNNMSLSDCIHLAKGIIGEKIVEKRVGLFDKKFTSEE